MGKKQPRAIASPYEDVKSSVHPARVGDAKSESGVGGGDSSATEGSLIHVYVPTSDNPQNLLCPDCRVPPSAEELQTKECSKCQNRLRSMYYRRWTPFIVGRLVLIFLVGFLVFGGIVFGIYVGATASGRTKPKLTKNNTKDTECRIYELQEWKDWGKCSSKCGNGTRSRDRTVFASGTHCPSLKQTLSCIEKACCDEGWSAPTNVAVNDWCYKEVKEKQTRAEAAEQCRKWNSDLARATDKEHWKYLHQLMGDEFWVGLRLQYNDSRIDFLGEDHSTVTHFYAPWAKRELFMKVPSDGIKNVIGKLEGDSMRWFLTEEGPEEPPTKAFYCCQMAANPAEYQEQT